MLRTFVCALFRARVFYREVSYVCLCCGCLRCGYSSRWSCVCLSWLGCLGCFELFELFRLCLFEFFELFVSCLFGFVCVLFVWAVVV